MPVRFPLLLLKRCNDLTPKTRTALAPIIADVRYLLSVIALDGNRRHVLPAEFLDDFYHGLRLKIIRRHNPREVLESRFVRQLGAS